MTARDDFHKDDDPVRNRLVELVNKNDENLARVSRAIGRNHAYLQQFVRRGSPRQLPYEVCEALADYFGVEVELFRNPSAKKASSRRKQRIQRKSSGHKAEDLRSFAVRLTRARIESRFETPSLFCAATGIDRMRYSDLEDGVDDPTLAELDTIAKVTGRSLDWLIRGDRDNNSPAPGSRRTTALRGHEDGRLAVKDAETRDFGD